MARGTTLVALLDQYRALARISLNPAHNVQVRNTQVAHLQRIQSWLWDEFDWPHMRVERQQMLVLGQRYYDPPADMKIERVNTLQVFRNGEWVTLRPGIGAAELSTYNSDLDARSWPPLNWQLHEDEDIEIWPIPEQTAELSTREGYLKIIGIRNLSPLVEDTDTADIDDRLIVGFAAAETLAASGAKDAQAKLDQTNQLYARLRGAQTKQRKMKMFDRGDCVVQRRIHIGTYRP